MKVGPVALLETLKETAEIDKRSSSRPPVAEMFNKKILATWASDFYQSSHKYLR